MNLDDYQQGAARTINKALDDDQRLLDAAAGLSEEAGEVLGHVRKHVMQGLTRELGDALWCIAVAAQSLGIPLSEVARINMDKLRQRYPDGFTTRE
jgi:NTP pyrophosphatase (non-canonical NTP hydrolase)